MIRKIKIGSYKPALDNGVAIQRKLIELVCDSNQNSTSINEQSILSLFVEASVKQWVKEFIGLKAEANTNKTMLDYLKSLADSTNKIIILDWYNDSFNFASHFPPNPSYQTWTATNSIPKKDWKELRTVLEKFYELFQLKGLPFMADGSSTSSKKTRLTRTAMVDIFYEENSDDVCYLCEGSIENPVIDHWIKISEFPSLSMESRNLFPICHNCNSIYKLKKQVYEVSSEPFKNWFHPYLLSAEDELELKYENNEVILKAKSNIAQTKIDNLEKLVSLSKRWTDEYNRQKKVIRNKILGRKKVNDEFTKSNIEYSFIINSFKKELEYEKSKERETFFLVRELILQEITKDQDSIDSFIEEINN